MVNSRGLFSYPDETMAKYTEKQFAIARTSYEAGDSLRDASRKSEIPETTLRRYAKTEGWECGKWRTQIETKANSIKNIIDVDEKMAQGMAQIQKQLSDDRILDLSGLKYKAQKVQDSMLDLINLATKQVTQVIENNPEGLHIKSQGETTGYGRNTEFVKDLIPAMNAANNILGTSKAQPDNPDNPVPQNSELPEDPIDASFVYQEFMKGL